MAEPTTWVVKDDYPAAAARAQEHGLVGFTLVVGTEGRATGCTVTETSGSADLDTATCALLIRRARFVSAADNKRAPVRDLWAGIIDWKLTPDQTPPPEILDCADCGLPWTAYVETLNAHTPLGDPVRWLRPADYPAKWRKGGGSVTVVLGVWRNGSVRTCKVSASSGSAKLDRLVCALLRRRARFQPERKAAAKWTSPNWEYRYAWKPGST